MKASSVIRQIQLRVWQLRFGELGNTEYLGINELGNDIADICNIILY